jgi:hypothetical protein
VLFQFIYHDDDDDDALAQIEPSSCLKIVHLFCSKLCNKRCHFLQILMSAEKDRESASMESATISKEASNVFVRVATS